MRKKRRHRRHLSWKQRQIRIYTCFIVVAGAACILMAAGAKKSDLSERLSRLTHKNIVNKAVEPMEQNISHMPAGTLITNYRYQEFGASDPNEIDVNAPMIALTFDDGPNPDSTKRILKVLSENYSHATFFVVGTNAAQYPETLQEIAASGCEIGNHTNNHKNLTKITDAEISEQIDSVNRSVKKATGEQTTVIRPPYGAFDDHVLGMLSEPVVLWDLDTEDWSSRNAAEIVEHVMDNVKDGDIVLMHDIYDSTAEAVEIMVPKLKERGFLIMSVSEMAKYKGKTLELNKAYGKISVEEE